MKRVLLATALTLFASSATFAAEPATTSAMSPSSMDSLMTKMPGDGVTVTNWYKQNVYDTSNNKIGEIVDVLVNKSGEVHSRHHLCRRLPWDGQQGRSRAIWRDSHHDEGQQVVAGYEHDQGCPQDRAWLQVRQKQHHVGVGQIITDVSYSTLASASRMTGGGSLSSVGLFVRFLYVFGIF